MNKPAFDFLKQDDEIGCKPLLAANLFYPKAAVPIVQNRAGEWGFITIVGGKTQSYGPLPTEAEAWRQWLDFEIFCGHVAPLNLLNLPAADNQTPIDKAASNLNDFDTFIKGLGAEV